jgi:predicted nuclease of predicted toxin-antitoxin system
MKVLFDNGTPRGVAAGLTEHTVEEARTRGWDNLRNGELLQSAELEGFDVLLTTDKNMRYQQNLSGRTIAVVVLSTGRWTLVKLRLDAIAHAVSNATPGSYFEVTI